MSFLLAIEGGDGAGKATCAAEVVAQLKAAGRTATVMSFPRYAETLGGRMLGEMLGGRAPQVTDPRATAVLYAFDRLESAPAITQAAAAHEVVVFDRFVASNMAYQAAQAAAEEADALMAWIARLEIEQFGLPAPDLNVYLDTPPDIARGLILRKRPRGYTDEALDAYEADTGLQVRVRANYATLVAGEMLGRWATVPALNAGALRPPREIAAEVISLIS